MNISKLVRRKRRLTIQWLAESIQQTAEAFVGHGNMQRRTGIEDSHAAIQPAGSMQRYRPDPSLIEMLMDLENAGFSIDRREQRTAQRRQHVTGNHDNRTLDLRDDADCSGFCTRRKTRRCLCRIHSQPAVELYRQ